VNAAKDSTELVAKLRAYHHNAQTKADKQHLAGYVHVLLEVMYFIPLTVDCGCILRILHLIENLFSCSQAYIFKFAGLCNNFVDCSELGWT